MRATLIPILLLSLTAACAGKGDKPSGRQPGLPAVIYTDLDGTFLDEDSRIPPDNLEAVRAFQAQGGKVSVATGRLPDRAWDYAAQMKVDLPAVFGNGAVIMNPDGSLLRMKAFHDPARVQAFCERIKAAECGFIYTSVGEAASGQIRVMEGDCRPPEDEGWGILKLRARNCKRHDALLAEIRELNTCGCSVIESGTGEYKGVSISAPGVGKAEALEYLAGLHKLDPKEMVFFGDSGNDTAALEWIKAKGGTCYAMPNGTPDVLQACPNRAPADNQQAGVGKAIYALLQAGRP